MKKKIEKKIISLIMTFIMVVGLFPFMSTTAFALVTGTADRLSAPSVYVGTTEVYTCVAQRFYKFIAPSTGIYTISTSDSVANPNTDIMSNLYANDDTTALAGDDNEDYMGHISYTAFLTENGVYYIDVQNLMVDNQTCMLNILAPAVAPTLTAGTVNRTSDTTATVNFTSDMEGSYYYKVVGDGDVEPTIDTDGVGITCTTSETTITNPIGLTEGAMDIYIIVKDGTGNKSTSLRIDIDAYIPSGDTAMFDFEGNTEPIADNTGNTALGTVKQTVNGKDILIVATDGKFVIGDEVELIGTFAAFDGNVLAPNVVNEEFANSTRVRVSLPGYSFNLNTFGILDNDKNVRSVGSIMLISSSTGYNVEEQIDYKGTDNGEASIDVSSNSGFQDITYFDFYADGSNMQFALDNIYLTNIKPLPAQSSDATLKTSSTVKGEAVTSLGTPSATLGSETAGAVTITAAKAADTSNATTFVTLFEKNDSNATVKAVKYASSSSTAGFATDAAYNNEAINNADFFIIKVTAEDSTSVNYYRINVEVTPAPSSDVTLTFESGNGLLLGEDTDSLDFTHSGSNTTFTFTAVTIDNNADTMKFGSSAGSSLGRHGAESVYTGWDGKTKTATVTIEPGKIFDLKSFYLSNQNGNGDETFTITTSKNGSFSAVAGMLSSDPIDTDLISLPATADFQGITWFKITTPETGGAWLEIDDILVANITTVSIPSSDATLKTSSTVKGVEVTSLGTPNDG
ncbi:MAG: hypothetical protein GX285_07055 [Clostridiales bacterium]|nr:hypothetical protein [Clostridiales bacterium]